MIRFSKRRFVKRNFWQLVLSCVAAAGLLFLFVKAQAVDPDKHNALISDLRELQMRDTELGEAVLQHHYQLFHNYDGVVAIMRRKITAIIGILLQLADDLLPCRTHLAGMHHRKLDLFFQSRRTPIPELAGIEAAVEHGRGVDVALLSAYAK